MLVLKILGTPLLACVLSFSNAVTQLHAIIPNSTVPMPTEFQENTNTSAVIAGKAVKKVQPKYPKEAKKARLEGEVKVKITVDEKGRVVKAAALNGDPILQEAAVKAAFKWRFEPTLLYGIPVKVVGQISFNFTLQEK
jgi:TonB family protein